MPKFKKGESGNPSGRPPGALNEKTLAIKELAQKLIEDPAYQASLAQRLEEGKAPHMETLLHHYAYGKPKESVEHSGPGGSAITTVVHTHITESK